MPPRDGLGFSGYLPPASVPPDPIDEDWRGEPGPPGTPGTPGAEGPPGPPVTDVYNARDFGIILDGVTDQGAALNAVLTSLPAGAHLFIPGSIYTTETIVVDLGRRLIMRNKNLIRPFVGSNLMACECAIIGSASLSPVVLCINNESGLTGVNITRNGTPAAGSIGLQCLGQNHIYTHVYSYNHARCIQVGAKRTTPVLGKWGCLATRFDHCIIWRGTEDWLYLINAPEVTVYDMRLGMNGEIDPTNPASLICIDGDLNSAVDAGSTNTCNFIRCQFNTTAHPQYHVRFHEYGSADGQFAFLNCFVGGAVAAFIYINPNCNVVRHIWVTACSILLVAGETFFSDTGKRVNGLEVVANHLSSVDAPPVFAFLLSGISATCIGNLFSGAFGQNWTPWLAVAGSTTQATPSSSRVPTPHPVASLSWSAATPPPISPRRRPATSITSSLMPTTINRCMSAAPVLPGASGSGVARDGGITGYVGHGGGPTGGDITELANMGGSPKVRLNAGNVGGQVQFWVNGAQVGLVDERGLTTSKVTTTTAPTAGFARLAFVAGTTAGTAKLVAYAGTSTTPTTIVDNIGAGF